MDKVFDEILGEVHVVLDVVEGHFRLNHPEFGQVARRVAVLGAERRTERVDVAESHGSQFSFQLSGDCQVGVLTEEVLFVINLTVFSARDVVKVESGDIEHLACTLCV